MLIKKKKLQDFWYIFDKKFCTGNIFLNFRPKGRIQQNIKQSGVYGDFE
jgi:hypothetical protein